MPFCRGPLNPSYRHGHYARGKDAKRYTPFGGNVSASKIIDNIGSLVNQGMEDLSRAGCSLQTLEPLHKAERAFSRALVRALKRERRSAFERAVLARKAEQKQAARRGLQPREQAATGLEGRQERVGRVLAGFAAAGHGYSPLRRGW